MRNTTNIKLRYRGKLNNPNDVHLLMQETADICKSNNWTHRIWDKDWVIPQSVIMNPSDGAINFEGHAPLKGITFSIGESEMVWLTFLPNGLLQSLFTLGDPAFFQNDLEFPWQRVKTGYDGATTHLALCKLFKYLSDKYFKVFKVLDESNYWEHGDEEKFTRWIDNLTRDEQVIRGRIGCC